MPDVRNSVWNLNGVPDLPREKQVEILNRLQGRVHELFDALYGAYKWVLDSEGAEFVEAIKNEPELRDMFRIMNEGKNANRTRTDNPPTS